LTKQYTENIRLNNANPTKNRAARELNSPSSTCGIRPANLVKKNLEKEEIVSTTNGTFVVICDTEIP
jgi:mannitol/fructose-specific phosphotransferase system IIA component